MPKRVSYRKIKTHRPYTPYEAATVLGVHRQTVIRWVKEQGLDADTSSKPWLIEGHDLRVFLGERQSRRKCKLDIHTFYCFGCRDGRTAAAKMADYVQQTATAGMLTAICDTCGTLIHKAVKRSDLKAIRAKLDVTIQTADARIVSRTDAPSNVTFATGAQTHAKAQC
jgi:excisionase family DNA binding protein